MLQDITGAGAAAAGGGVAGAVGALVVAGVAIGAGGVPMFVADGLSGTQWGFCPF